jgi:MFS family permease
MAGLACGITLSISGLVIMIFAQGFAPYVLGTVIIGFSWAFCLPYIQGLMASLDPHGSAIAAGSASSTIGGAFGPGLAALVLGSSEYRNVFLFAISLLLVALTGLYFSSHHAARQRPGVYA